jgi:hypothetical protein
LEWDKTIGYGQWYVFYGLDAIGLDNNSSVAKPFEEVQKTVINLLNGRMLIGHALGHDLKVLIMPILMRL